MLPYAEPHGVMKRPNAIGCFPTTRVFVTLLRAASITATWFRSETAAKTFVPSGVTAPRCVRRCRRPSSDQAESTARGWPAGGSISNQLTSASAAAWRMFVTSDARLAALVVQDWPVGPSFAISTSTRLPRLSYSRVASSWRGAARAAARQRDGDCPQAGRVPGDSFGRWSSQIDTPRSFLSAPQAGSQRLPTGPRERSEAFSLPQIKRLEWGGGVGRDKPRSGGAELERAGITRAWIIRPGTRRIPLVDR